MWSDRGLTQEQDLVYLQELEEGDSDVANPILAESDWIIESVSHILNETNSTRSEPTLSANLSEDAASTSANVSDIQEKNKGRINE